MRIILFIALLVAITQAQIKNSYGKTKWGIKGTAVYVDTTGAAVPTWKSVGTVDTSKAFPWGQSSGQYILAWRHASNGDDSGQFALRFLCYDSRIGRWMDTAQYQASSVYAITKSVTTLKDTLPGLYNGTMTLCDSLKVAIKGTVATNTTDTVFIQSLQMRSVYGTNRGESH